MELIISINALFNGNAKFKEAGAAFENLQRKTKKLQEVTGDVGNYQRLQESITSTSGRLEKLRGAYQTQASELAIMGARHGDLGTRYQEERAKLKTLTKGSAEYQAQAQKVSRLAKDYKNNAQELKNFERVHKDLEREINSVSKSLDAEKIKLGEVSGKLSSSGYNVEKLSSRHEQLTAALKRSESAQARITQLRENLSYENIKANAIAPAVALGASVAPMVKIAADFESAMARVKAVSFSGSDADMKMFAALTEQARQLGASTQFTAAQAAGAMENLARAGMQAKDIQETMPALLDMAAAEGMGLEQAAGILASVQSGMNMLASDSTRIADVLAYTSGASKTSIATLGEALKVAAPSAAALNVKLEQMAGLLGVLGNKGFEGSEAGNALSSAFTRLSQGNTQKVLNSLGVAVKTRTGEMRELPDILKAINDAFEKRNLGEVERIAYMSEIFGQNYGKQMLALASDVEGIKNIELGAKTGASGRASTMANINLDTLNGQLTILSSAWDGFRMKIGDAFSPVIRAGVEALSGALSGITSIMEKFPTLSNGIILAFGAIASYKTLSGIAGIAKSFLSLPGAMLEVVNAGRQVSSVLGEAGKFAGMAKGFSSVKDAGLAAFGILKSGALSAMSIITAHPLIAGGAALVAGVALLVKNWDAIKNKIGGVVDWCAEKWGAFANYFANFKMPDIWGGLVSSFSSAIDTIKGMWESLQNFFANLNPFKNAGEALQTAAVNAKSTKGLQPGTADYHIAAMNSAYAPPGFATGGILTRPTFAQVAEDGPEAIIPLRDPARGVPLVMQAAQELGMLKGENNNARNNIISGWNNGGNIGGGNISPVINISVNNSGENSGELAEIIARKVREVLENLSSISERVSYA